MSQPPDPVAALLTDLATRGVEIRAKGDRLRCTATCKRCSRAIAWGKVVSDTTGRDVGRWLALDDDYMPHGCNGRATKKNP